MDDISDDIVKTARKRFEQAAADESDCRRERLDDLKFLRLGEQWPEGVKRDRSIPGRERPMHVINRLQRFRNLVINDIRQNSPSIKIRPFDDAADPEIAELRQDVVRHIQDASSATIAYDTAAEFQVDSGLGYIHVKTDFCDDQSFDQDVIIERIEDPFKVYCGPYRKPDGSDMEWAFLAEDIPRDEFEEDYPGKAKNWDGIIDGGWITKDSVRVVGYFYLEESPRTLCQLADGRIAWKDEIPEGVQILRERKVEQKTCKWCKIAGDEILEETELPTSFIPIVPVLGNEVWIDGKRHVYGLVRFGKDPQRQYNYLQSANTEVLALAPKAPYIGAEGQFEGHEQEWALSNRVNLPYLEYKPITLAGSLAPAPQRTPMVLTNPGFEAAMARAEDDMKAAMGIYDASLGNREASQSGKAILSQQRQADVGNFHFSDNLSRSLKQVGRIIMEMAFDHPKHVYDTPRVVRLVGEDGEVKTARIDPNQPQASTEYRDQNGEVQKIFNPGVGRYDVVVDVGPSYMTRRQEAAASMVQMAQADPKLFEVAGDLIVRNMDWPGADEIADRMKKALPPQLQQEQDGDENPQITGQMNQMADQMEHMSQVIAQLQSDKAERDRKLAIEEFDAMTRRISVENSVALTEGKIHELVLENLKKHLQIIG